MTNEKVGVCIVCGINVYDRGKLNRPFMFQNKQHMGLPKAMPCGIFAAPCPFETKEEQAKVEKQKAIGIFSGRNTYE